MEFAIETRRLMMVNQETLDFGYLEKWAERLGLAELLANAWALANESKP